MGVQITTEKRRLLGAAIGNTEKFTETIISPLVQQVYRLAEVAQSQPQAAHAAFTHGLILTRTSSSNIAKHLQPLEDAIRLQFIPSLTGRSPHGNDERDLLAVPRRLGGLGLVNPRKEVEIEQANSQHVTALLVTRILEQDENISDIQEELQQCKREAHNSKCKHQQESATTLKSELPAALLSSAELATGEDASSWLTVTPLDHMVSPCIRERTMMPFACGMVGCHQCLPHTVFVDDCSQLHTHCSAPLEDTHPSAITNCVISLQTY